jgi:hypothetical protein
LRSCRDARLVGDEVEGIGKLEVPLGESPVEVGLLVADVDDDVIAALLNGGARRGLELLGVGFGRLEVERVPAFVIADVAQVGFGLGLDLRRATGGAIAVPVPLAAVASIPAAVKPLATSPL